MAQAQVLACGDPDRNQSVSGVTMKLRAHGRRLFDVDSRDVVLHGINLVDKGKPGSRDPEDFRGSWTRADLEDLRALGLNCVRLGVNWAATVPEIGQFSEPHLAWLAQQLDQLHELGFHVFLDAHQDLYSQRWGNGAPDWATLTSQPFESTQLWSDAYLSSPAVHEALDAFWGNAPAPDGVGLQDHYATFWAEIAQRFGEHPALIGYDIMNEPTPGAASAEIFGAILAAFASQTGQAFDDVMGDFTDPQRKLSQLGHLDDSARHRAIGDAMEPIVRDFETRAIAPMFRKVAEAIRSVDSSSLIIREHNYFSNIGIPAGSPALDDAAWVYSPHGYDLVVDTEMMPLASNRRIQTIFERARETAQRWDVPVIVGEWGAFGRHQGIAEHSRHQLDLFDSFGWGWTYWCWEPGFTEFEVAATLRRPRPVAIDGTGLSYGPSVGGWRAQWEGSGAVESCLWVPGELSVTLSVDGRDVTPDRRGDVVVVGAAPGHHVITVN